MRKITYHGINPQIIATATMLANNIVTRLRLPQDEKDDLIQQLIIAGIRIEQRYRPGDYSLSSYLTKHMLYMQLDIMRSYLTIKRRTQLCWGYEGDDRRKVPFLDFLPDTSPDNDVIGITHLHDVLNALPAKEKDMADLLLQGYTTEEAAEKLGFKPRYVELLRAKIRKNHKKLKK